MLKDQQLGIGSKTGSHTLSGLPLASIVEMVLMCQGKVTQMCFACVISLSWEILFVYLPWIPRMHQALKSLKSQNLCQYFDVGWD